VNTPPTALIDGYRRFRATRYPEEAARYAGLADGQAPKTMVIACADSRVDPATIFGVAPGELFIVRNVANLVPPCVAPSASLHGTSAALEFAVDSLRVENIVVMGHGGCGGIAASLAEADDRPIGQFITPWVSLLKDVRDEMLATAPEDPQTSLEHGGIRQSLENLKTFPFIAEAVAEGRLTLHGAWFAIGLGELHWLNGTTGHFDTITA
jgi:carbonic anhydrase